MRRYRCPAGEASGAGQLAGTRDCEVRWIGAAVAGWAIDRMITMAQQGPWQLDFDRHSDFVQLTSYGPGQRYDWHMDLGPGPMSLRKISVVSELQSAPGGGLEVFPMGNIGLRPGDVAVFPSFIMHRATAPAEGVRWSLTLWLCGKEPLR